MIERRAYPRVRTHVPIEVTPDEAEAPIRASTADVSVGGCYCETIFPLPTGTSVEVRLRTGELTVSISGAVKTCDPQVGNGIEFVRMLPEDRTTLVEFIHRLEKMSEAEPDGIAAVFPSIIRLNDALLEADVERFGKA